MLICYRQSRRNLTRQNRNDFSSPVAESSAADRPRAPAALGERESVNGYLQRLCLQRSQLLRSVRSGGVPARKGQAACRLVVVAQSPFASRLSPNVPGARPPLPPGRPRPRASPERHLLPAAPPGHLPLAIAIEPVLEAHRPVAGAPQRPFPWDITLGLERAGHLCQPAQPKKRLQGGGLWLVPTWRGGYPERPEPSA